MSFSETINAIITALTVVNIVSSIYRARVKALAEKFDRQFDEARTASEKDGGTLLSRFCEECARRIQKHPQDAETLRKWGIALWWRASKKSGGEADQLYEQADKKFAQAQAIAPNKGEIRADRAEAMRCQAALHDNEAGRRLLIKVCEQCEAWLSVFCRSPNDARMCGIWGLALWWLAGREKGAEAERLYEEADEKFARGYAIAPDQTDIAINRAEALFWRSGLASGGKQREILVRICGQCEELASKSVGGARMLETWGGALCWLGAQAEGAEARRLFTEAEEKLSRALKISPGSTMAEMRRARAMLGRAVLLHEEERQTLLVRVCEVCERFKATEPRIGELFEMWATTLSWQAIAATGSERDRLFAEAVEKFDLALSSKPGDEATVTGLAAALYYRATLCDGDEARALITRASGLLEAASRETSGYAALAWWVTVLALRGKLLPGDETNRLLEEAARRFDAAKQNGADPDALLSDRRLLMWAQAVSEAAKVQ